MEIHVQFLGALGQFGSRFFAGFSTDLVKNYISFEVRGEGAQNFDEEIDALAGFLTANTEKIDLSIIKSFWLG